jgi:hypothetical protein
MLEVDDTLLPGKPRREQFQGMVGHYLNKRGLIGEFCADFLLDG